MNIGIICEYNPFHYGHLYHLKMIKKLYPDSNITLILTGWICQRGELSLIDKFKKTKIALESGADLVVELPFKYIQSADIFAKGVIEILNKLKCDTIVFGSESNDINLLIKLANIQLNEEKYNKLVKNFINEGINYPTAVCKTFKILCGKSISSPNDLLGLSYVKEIIKNNYNITPVTIKRNSNFNSKKIEGKITSARSIRELLKNGKNVKKYVPKESLQFLNKNDIVFLDDYFDLLKYKIISETNLTIYQGVDESIQNRIKKYINKSKTLEELLSLIKTKRYTYNRLKRTLTFILFSITKLDVSNLKLEYIRVLGFDKVGMNRLKKIKKDIDVKILTNYDDNYLNKDLQINNIVALNRKINNKTSFIEKEYKEKPIMK